MIHQFILDIKFHPQITPQALLRKKKKNASTKTEDGNTLRDCIIKLI